jgi:hypothetical protein
VGQWKGFHTVCIFFLAVGFDGTTGRIENMKSDKTQSKLRLNKETLRNLTDDSLSQVAGGNGDSAGIICVFSVLLICGDSVVCSVLAGSCDNDNGSDGDDLRK